MKVSIITVVFNGQNTIEDCLNSIYRQTYPDIEHIVIDGGSTDATLAILKKYSDKIARLISEPDRGIYDAMNKGIQLATGDIIGLLNCDDLYIDESVIQNIVDAMQKNSSDTCYGDLQYVRQNHTQIVIRNWVAGKFSVNKFKYGWMPPHPTFFVRKTIYERCGLFNTAMRIAADYEMMLRLLFRYHLPVSYVPRALVRMRTGGSSKAGLRNTFLMAKEEYNAWKINGLTPHVVTFIIKRLRKVPQYIMPWLVSIMKIFKCK